MLDVNHTMKGKNHPPYSVPACESRVEIQVKNSRFIACAALALTVEDAREYIRNIRKEFADASHHVPAFLVGFGASVTEHCHDDREPTGTAGKPVLEVLKGSQIGDVAIVVVRYFGGTRLGTGGLARAYRDAAKAVIEQMPLALKTLTCEVVAAFPYAHYQKARGLLDAHQGTLLDESFSENVTLTCRLPSQNVNLFTINLTDLTQGKCWQITRRDVIAIVPQPVHS
ncbi:MAG: YigZ family protein [Bellilinea sp.]|jgi:uncharacterized YigZ family protein